MEKKIKFDPNKIEFDGKGFKIAANKQKVFTAKLKKLQNRELPKVL